MTTFWMVLGRDGKHTTETQARAEAVRLARLYPGESFTVLESLTTVTVDNVKWEEHTDDEILF